MQVHILPKHAHYCQNTHTLKHPRLAKGTVSFTIRPVATCTENFAHELQVGGIGVLVSDNL
jgi:hypothetical protein